MATIIRLNGAGASGAAGGGASPTTLLISFAGGQGQIGVAYYGVLIAYAGTLPYTFSISAGALPTGLSLSATTGLIYGSPTVTGTFTFTGQVADSATHTANTGSVSITVGNALPAAPTSVVIAEAANSRSLTTNNQTITTINVTVTLGVGNTASHLNIFYMQAPGGVCNTSGTSVTSTLNTFNQYMTTININGTNYGFTYIDGQDGTLATSAGTQTAVAWVASQAGFAVIQEGYPVAGSVTVFQIAGVLIYGEVYQVGVSTGNLSGDNWNQASWTLSNQLTLTQNSPLSTAVSTAAVTNFTGGLQYWGCDIQWTTNPALDPDFYYADLTVQQVNGSGTPDGNGEHLVAASDIIGTTRNNNIRDWGYPLTGDAYPLVRFQLRVVNRASPAYLTGVLQACWPGGLTHFDFSPTSSFALSLPPIQKAALAVGPGINQNMTAGNFGVAAGNGVTFDGSNNVIVKLGALGGVTFDSGGHVIANTGTGGVAIDSSGKFKVVVDNSTIQLDGLGNLFVNQISATKVTAGTFVGGVIYAGTINANQINAGTISVGSGGMTFSGPGGIILSDGSGHTVSLFYTSTGSRFALEVLGQDFSVNNGSITSVNSFISAATTVNAGTGFIVGGSTVINSSQAFVGTGGVSTSGAINTSSTYQTGGTTVIDSSRTGLFSSLSVGGSTVIDSSRNSTFNSTTVNGVSGSGTQGLQIGGGCRINISNGGTDSGWQNAGTISTLRGWFAVFVPALGIFVKVPGYN